MAREDIMAKQLRALVPYIEAHDPTKRRFAPSQSAPPKTNELSPAEIEEAGDIRRQNRQRGGQT